MTLQVGDIVVVGRRTGINAANARAIVVEHYRLKEAGAERDGWTLLFDNGAADGFSPSDCELLEVQTVGHEAAFASYRFLSMSRLDADFRRGIFARVWATERRS